MDRVFKKANIPLKWWTAVPQFRSWSLRVLVVSPVDSHSVVQSPSVCGDRDNYAILWSSIPKSKLLVHLDVLLRSF